MDSIITVDNRQRSIDPHDNDPTSVVGFLDHWTDKVRLGRNLLGAGACPAHLLEYIQIRTGPRVGVAYAAFRWVEVPSQRWSHAVRLKRSPAV